MPWITILPLTVQKIYNEFISNLSVNLCDGVIDPHYLTSSQKIDFEAVLNETYQSILKCLNFKFGI